MRSVFLAAVLLLAAADVHPQERARFCARAPSLADITYVCGKGGGFVRLTAVIMAMNAKVGATRYATINEVEFNFSGSVTIPASEPAFLKWVTEHGLEIASRDKEMIVLRLPLPSSSKWIKSQGANR